MLGVLAERGGGGSGGCESGRTGGTLGVLGGGGRLGGRLGVREERGGGSAEDGGACELIPLGANPCDGGGGPGGGELRYQSSCPT